MTTDTSTTSGNLIAADKVNGTDVYDHKGQKLGSVEDIMIDKISGRAIYAVLSFDGFLGVGAKHYPLPWASLNYDTNKGGYVVDITKKTLEEAPNFDGSRDFQLTPEYGRTIDSYYNAPSYWN
jgi:sporulation protein YlmC with PRC-barrel domain